MNKKKVLIIGAGGTITAKMVKGSWRPGGFTGQDILEFVPEVKHLADITTIELYKIDSSDMQPSYWIEIAKTIYKNYKNYDGIVITHGTDTMHYTASALSFLLQNIPIPIVLTGSQVPPHKEGSDARRNLLDAVRIASQTDICEVTIVFNSKILRGNRAKKFREVEFEAFESVGMLPLGVIEHDINLIGKHIKKKREKIKFYDKLEEKVCILKITPGFDPRIIRKVIELGYKGLVIEGFGAGNIPILENSLIPEIKNAVKKNIPIIGTTQCAIGCSWMYLYEGGKRALDAGVIPGYDMISDTAMVKLMWILGNYPKNMKKIREMALKNIAGEISNVRTPKEKRIWEYSL